MPAADKLIAPVVFLTICCVIAASIWSGDLVLPPRWNPWAPLHIAEAPGLFTRMKLDRLDARPAQCLATLEAGGARFTPLEPRADGADCGWQNGVRIAASGVAFSSSFVLTCPAAVSLLLWERHALQPAAQLHLGTPVRRIDHLGSYACRNVNGAADGRRSEHAHANALDVAGFVLADGRQVRVQRDWDGAADAAAFLREVHDGACPFFDGVLGPAYNAAHRNHFHLDRGPYRVCR